MASFFRSCILKSPWSHLIFLLQSAESMGNAVSLYLDLAADLLLDFNDDGSLKELNSQTVVKVRESKNSQWIICLQ